MIIFFINIEALLTIKKRLYFLLPENLHNIILISFNLTFNRYSDM